MTKADNMMILDVDKRRLAFRNMYALELGRLHATGVCRWPIERLPKYFGLKSSRAVLEFLEF